MGRKIEVIVIDKNILELKEDASKGDIINLSDITEVDTSFLEKIIEDNKDKVYASKLEDAIKIERANFNVEKTNLKSELEKYKSNFDTQLSLEKEKLKSSKEVEINRIKEEEYKKLVVTEKELAVFKTNYQTQLAFEIEKNKNELEGLKNKELLAIRNSYEETLRLKENTINELNRIKSSMNVKQTGEDLEAWCNNEVAMYMQTGLFNCSWKKDNEVVKDLGETKGSKADYIFKIYASKEHKEEEILTSLCLEMKDENPESTNKQTNQSYYKQLDKNRLKKNCKYAVLVSNLERDKSNALPIFKVIEYQDMYVVRPDYLMVFLNMIVSLSTKFSELLLSKGEEILEFKNRQDIIEAFDAIKNTYLDKPLLSLKNSIDSIKKQSDSIKKAYEEINKECEKIADGYIEEIRAKLDKFSAKLDKEVVKKIEKL